MAIGRIITQSTPLLYGTAYDGRIRDICRCGNVAKPQMGSYCVGVTYVDSRGKRGGGSGSGTRGQVGRWAGGQVNIRTDGLSKMQLGHVWQHGQRRISLMAWLARLRVGTHAYARHGPRRGSEEGPKRSPRIVYTVS